MDERGDVVFAAVESDIVVAGCGDCAGAVVVAMLGLCTLVVVLSLSLPACTNADSRCCYTESTPRAAEDETNLKRNSNSNSPFGLSTSSSSFNRGSALSCRCGAGRS